MDTGITITVPPTTERLDVPVSVVDGEARFDPRALAQAYGREIPGITVAAADVGIVTFNQDEADLANRMRAQGATSVQIRNAVENLRRNRTVLPESDRRANFPLTRPTGQRGGGNLTGAPAITPENASSSQRAGTRGQNESMQVLDRAGYRGHHNPKLSAEELRAAGLDADARPDAIIENRVFDVHTPNTSDAHSLRGHISNKVARGQANRIVVNLSHTNISRAALARELQATPIQGLREVITIDQQGRIGHAFP